MVPQLLGALQFRSNNDRHRPVIQALALIQRFAGTKVRLFPVEESVPLEGVVRGLWREAVIEIDAAGEERVNRITYEIAVLQALRQQLRCKEIWVVGANRYRNPDHDLPEDFTQQRTEYWPYRPKPRASSKTCKMRCMTPCSTWTWGCAPTQRFV